MPDQQPDIELAAEHLTLFLKALGHSESSNAELAGTGLRVARAFSEELLVGYQQDPREALCAPIAATSKDLILIANLRTVAMCPHHLLPVVGYTHIVYQPDGLIAGFGAFSEVVQTWARRLILQEVLVSSITQTIEESLTPLGLGVMVELESMCMTLRGTEDTHARTASVAFSDKSTSAFRSEFFSMIAPYRKMAQGDP